MADWGKVFIGLRYQPSLPAWTCESLMGLVQFGLREGDRRSFVYSKTMHKAANQLAREFLASDCDSLLFIDSDAVFGSSALEELRSDAEGHEYDVLQAFTVKRGWPPEPMFLAEHPDQPVGEESQRGTFLMTQLPLDPDHIYPVGAVSLHFTLIRRSVFARILGAGDPRFIYWFEYSQDNGEDVTFSIKAKECGARMGMTTKLKVGHMSEGVHGWDTMVDYFYYRFMHESGELPPPSLEPAHRHAELQRSLSELVAEYTGESVETVFERSCAGGLPVRDAWQVAHPKTANETRAFYGRTTQYFYDLVKWNSSPAFQRLIAPLHHVRGERVLEIGGGLGTVSELLAAHGNRVDYYDVPGVLRDFAAWRFTRLNGHSANVSFVDAWEESIYDRIIALDVLEHVHPDEVDSMLRAIAFGLKPGGVFMAHNTWDQMGGVYPFHFDHSKRWGAFLEDNGFRKESDTTWRKS
jgi:2-polyprenyl-3-methyl-5-hydroxy-6-metoxy-1,4-benzoquinol methylase